MVEKQIGMVFLKKMPNGCGWNNLAVSVTANALPDILLEDGKCDGHGGYLVVVAALRPFYFPTDMYCLCNVFQMLDNQQNLLHVFGFL